MFRTYTGKLIDLSKPDPELVDILDIAHSLAHLGRFNGHFPTLYSVAEHSIRCAAMVPDDLKLYALLHDAAEAYVGDVTRPLKVLLGPAYRDLEREWHRAIAVKFGLPFEVPAEVKEADDAILRAELLAMQNGNLCKFGSMEFMVGRFLNAFDKFTSLSACRSDCMDCRKCGEV